MAESSYWASLVAQMVKNHLQCGRHSLGWEDPQEEGMATHSSILAWRIPMDRGAWHVIVHGVAKSWHNWATKHSTHRVHTPQTLAYLLPSRQQMTWSLWLLRKGRLPGRDPSTHCLSICTLTATQTHPSPSSKALVHLFRLCSGSHLLHLILC